MLRKLLPIYSISLVLALSYGAFAHGTEYRIIQPQGVQVQALFEGGVPMANAAVLVFPPGAVRAQDTLYTDANGIFSAVPDKPGTWAFQVRDKSGHGMRINLEVNKDLGIGDTGGGNAVSARQRVLMAACVVWGLLGTALYFKRRA